MITNVRAEPAVFAESFRTGGASQRACQPRSASQFSKTHSNLEVSSD
jgi:hypothetical protein